MQVFHTCGVPPSFGKIILPIIGCTRNSKKALTKRVMAKSGRAKDHLQSTGSHPRSNNYSTNGKDFRSPSAGKNEGKKRSEQPNSLCQDWTGNRRKIASTKRELLASVAA